MNFLKYSFLLIGCSVTLFIQGQSNVQKDLYQAFLHDDVTKWEKVTYNFEKNADLSKSADLLKLIHCYYGYISVLIDKNQDKKADENIKKAETYIDKILKAEPNNATALNYKGVFISYYVSMNKMKAATLGKQILTNLNKAYSLDPNNVQILFDRGNSFFYPPKMFGGNKSEALKCYQKAISIIEKQKSTKENWIYVQLLFLVGRCNELMGNLDLAKKGYEKTLMVEPNLKLVRDKYYPGLLKKMS